jgi:Reverse transcriptase (RNA-dependent DNA polymerase)
MNADGKSDRPVVPMKSPNKAEGSAAEAMEGRGRTKGNRLEGNTLRTQGRDGVHSALERVRQVAKEDRKQRFTALLHHVYDIERLRSAYFAIKRDAAAGVDGETWRHYRENLEENLRDLSLRLKRGAYRARPVRRAFIPKDGGQRPLGVPVLEDKIVQRAVVEVLNAIYEEDHYVFDLWVQRWRQKQARGDVIVVRFADDFVVGFEHRVEAERFLTELRERFARFGLELHPEKTRLIEFGPRARRNREDRGDRGAPGSFNFLGFTHSCGKQRKGGFTVLRQTMRKRWQAKLKAVKTELRARMHDPIPEVGKYLRSVVLGHVRYYGVPMNGPSLGAFRGALGRVWWSVLRRRSQGNHLPWRRMRPLIDTWLPPARICHPYPSQRLRVTTRGGSRMR